MEIAFRKWVDEIRLEVRGFICCGELNAVTIQPNQEDVPDETRKILAQLLNSHYFNKDFVKSIVDLYFHCIFDLAFFPDYKPIHIEINPFGKMAHSGFFSWVLDKTLLYRGRLDTGQVTVRFYRD